MAELYQPPLPFFPHWYAAITTAPRKQPTLQQTVNSIRRAGLEPHVFAEPSSPPCDAHTVTHSLRKGVWHNWLHAARAALDSGKEYLMIVQDDLSIHSESVLLIDMLLEEVRYARGPVSLYTPMAYSRQNDNAHYPRKAPGIYPVVSDKLWGAVGFVWRHADLLELMHHPKTQSWSGIETPFKPTPKTSSDVAQSDVAIGQVCKAMGIKAWFPVPSLGVHTARYSSIPGHGSNDAKQNRNAERPVDFAKPLHGQLFPSKVEMAEHEPTGQRVNEYRPRAVFANPAQRPSG